MMARYLFLILLFVGVVFVPDLSGAFMNRYACQAPTPPSAPSPTLPSPPVCASFDGDLGKCPESQIQLYRKSIEAYVESLREYSDKAAKFADQAEDYARCKSEEANEVFKKNLGNRR